MVEEGQQVVGEAGEAGAAGGLGRAGEAAVGEHDAGVAAGEVGELLPPAEVVAAEAVGEDQRRGGRVAGAVDLVVQIAVRAGEGGHGCAYLGGPCQWGIEPCGEWKYLVGEA